MALTEHRSVAQAVGYFQAGDATNNPAARLLDDKVHIFLDESGSFVPGDSEP